MAQNGNIEDILGNIVTNEGIQTKVTIELTQKTYRNLFFTITFSVLAVYLLTSIFSLITKKI
jgi:hypothetical protein